MVAEGTYKVAVDNISQRVAYVYLLERGQFRVYHLEHDGGIRLSMWR